MRKLVSPDGKPKTLPPVHPNVGTAAGFKRKLERLIDEMHASTTYWLLASYRKNEPVMAQDEAPADALRKTMAGLSRRWNKRFDEGAKELAEYFALSVSERTDAALRAILKKAGFSVEFRLTAAQRDIVAATVNQNVSLIKSIPDQYLAQVEQSVMRSVQTGRDIGGLAKELQTHFGVTKKRAQFIATDQNEKATSALNASRQTELGIVTARWRHSGAGAHPRPSHVKAGRDGVIYNIKDGWLDPSINKRIWPGSEIRCRCGSSSLIPGFI
jgi:SPP1 gp7 family putative phage head morphogenesis protein